jgi:hypothetical protein
MPISFHADDELPHTVVAVLAQHSDRTVVVLNYTLVELMSPLERMEMLNALFAKVDRPPTGRRLDELDELAAPRRQRSRRTEEGDRHTEPSTAQPTELRRLGVDRNRHPDAGGE